MELSLKDRLLVGSLLPQQGDFITLTIADEIREKVKLDDKERKKFELTIDPQGNASWNEEGKKAAFKIEFTDEESGLISKRLEELDKQKALRKDHIFLYKTFVKKD